MAASRITLPKGVWFQRKRLSTGQVIRYGYLGRGSGSIALGREGSVEFFERLADAVRRRPPDGTVKSLIWRYRQSPEFLGLRPRTKADYLKLLDKVEAHFGPLSLRAIGSREIAQHIFEWRDSMAKTPRRADYAVQVLKVLLSWGARHGLIEANRALGIGRLYRSNRSEKTWTDSQIDAFLKVACEPMRRALIVALETGQRQGDLLLLSWTAVGAETIKLRQAKTGARVSVPISEALEGTLAVAPRGTSTTVLTKADGLPWDPKGNGFRNAWGQACRDAGVSGVTFHDLRGTFVSRRLSAGWTTQEVAMCTGHSLRDLASIDAYADREIIAEANAVRLVKRERESVS